MRERARTDREGSIRRRASHSPKAEEVEAGEFIEWLADNHFTFLGYREYRLERGTKSDQLVPVPTLRARVCCAPAAGARSRSPPNCAANCSARRASLRC